MKHMYIIDAYNLIYRMFYAIPEMHTRDGVPVNAVYGVAKFLRSLYEQDAIDSLLVASDAPGRSLRTEQYGEYKATRDRMPDNLRIQLSTVFELFSLLHIPVLEVEWYEADDVIGSLVISAKEKKNPFQSETEITIISSDKDLCQFVDDGHVRIYDAMKQKVLDHDAVLAKFAIRADQVVDYLAIVGDSSDNIPWISGFWPKKAEDLLGKYGSLDGIYAHLDEIPEKLRTPLTEQKERAYLSRALATIHTDLDIVSDLSLPSFRSDEFWTPPVVGFFQKLEFYSLLPSRFQKAKPTIEPTSVTDILHPRELQSIEKNIQEWPSQEIILSTVWGRFTLDTLIFSYAGIIYRLDVKKVESEAFLSWLIHSDVRIVWYALAEDLERISGFLSHRERGKENQATLF